ncbi:MAG: hypothetical protein Q8921_09740, partial [Bacteroidota bacterium]|nr:hypothetical protein [Bacteroidota bacterium]
MLSISGRSFAQGGTNTPGGQPWPNNPPVGIGTQVAGGATPVDALQIHFDPALLTTTMPAILRFTNGGSPTSDTFAILGLMPPPVLTTYSSISTGQDLILHEHSKGDVIITNFWAAGSPTAHTGGSIRLATAGDTTVRTLDTTLWHHDYERLTIAPNGNVGINLPPISTGLDSVAEQLQIGGGSVAGSGYLDPLPGLTLYGGNRYEGLPIRASTAFFPSDWRYIAFNYAIDHSNPDSTRNFRSARMGASGIKFADPAGGLVQIGAWPYDSSRGMHDFSRGLTLELTGSHGLAMWSDESDSDQWHHLFDAYRPGYLPSGTTRNINGLFYHHTPVYIGGTESPDFTDFAHVNPTLGDGKTWMLAVNGPMVAKEIFVLDTVWADFVFQPEHKL